MDQTFGYGGAVADARSDVRSEFLRKTYLHLALAVVAFVGLEAALLQIPGVEHLVRGMTGMAWLVVLLLFMVVSHVADGWARSATSLSRQYLGLGL